MARSSPLRLGTRRSLLAQMQSRWVADQLQRLHPGLRVELVTIRTTGDAVSDRPLHEAGGKGVFTREIEQALIDGGIDLAVHSFKDVPVTMPLVDASALVFAAVPKREDPRDALISVSATTVERLPPRARVGTSSLRRTAQVLALREDVTILPIRGNIDTRLRKLREGPFDAILLALAGLKRAGLFDEHTMIPIDAAQMLPAAGQGALAIQCRADDRATNELVEPLNDPDSQLCVSGERMVVEMLQGDCHSPIAALATVERGGSGLALTAAVAGRDGRPPVLRAWAQREDRDIMPLVRRVTDELLAAGAARLLAGGGAGAPGTAAV